MKSVILLFVLVFSSFQIFSQGVIRGKITNPVNNQPVAFANVLILETDLGAVSDENGLYEISNVPPGLYNVRASFVGFKAKTFFEIQVTLAKPVQLDFELDEDASELSEVLVSSEFSRSEDTPISVEALPMKISFISMRSKYPLSTILLPKVPRVDLWVY